MISLHLDSENISKCLFLSLVDCLHPSEQFFSYPAAVIITGDRASDLDLCSVLMAFSSEGSFTYQAWCDMGPWFKKCHPKD
jgi:hypothetical protein